MSRISELYGSLYEKLRTLKDQLDEAASCDALQAEQDEAIRQRRIANLREQLKKIDEFAGEVERFRLLSEKNLTSKNILTITPRELNLTRLRNWTTMMDPEKTDDPYAKRVYVQACCNQMFLERKKEEFKKKLNELENKTEELSGETARKAEAEQKKNRLLAQVREILESEEAAELAKLLAQQGGNTEGAAADD